jgi:hypothetical protein
MLFIHDALQLFFGSAFQKSFENAIFFTHLKECYNPHKLFRGLKLKPKNNSTHTGILAYNKISCITYLLFLKFQPISMKL